MLFNQTVTLNKHIFNSCVYIAVTKDIIVGVAVELDAK